MLCLVHTKLCIVGPFTTHETPQLKYFCFSYGLKCPFCVSFSKLPILSTGEGVGRRVCLCEGVSSVSGPWRVEECGGGSGEEEECQGERTRRLVFVKTSHLVQTEMRLRPCEQPKSQFCCCIQSSIHILRALSVILCTWTMSILVPSACINPVMKTFHSN